MEIKLLHVSPLKHIISGIRKCWKSEDKSDNGGAKDIGLIKRIISAGHTSTLEHGIVIVDIKDVSRA
jgi:thymidylate synthase ThyX